MWSTRTAKYKVQMVNDRTTSVSVELLEDGVSVHSRTITEQEYKNGQYNLFLGYHLCNLLLIHSIAAKVSSSAPKLVWEDFLQVLQVFMLGNNQEQESDIKRAFDILDQCSRGLYGRTIRLSDGLISPDELRAFLAILTDEMDLAKLACLNSPEWSSQDWQETLSANAYDRLNDNYSMNWEKYTPMVNVDSIPRDGSQQQIRVFPVDIRLGIWDGSNTSGMDRVHHSASNGAG
ncbi:hypothetical protein I4U23_016469 [Adineta vaga]|nr:hypothetical protein I4U23_016469 [Adineta vaga]